MGQSIKVRWALCCALAFLLCCTQFLSAQIITGSIGGVVTDATGARSMISAAYVRGCDGPRSTVREAIGSAYEGEHALRPVCLHGVLAVEERLRPHRHDGAGCYAIG